MLFMLCLFSRTRSVLCTFSYHNPTVAYHLDGKPERARYMVFKFGNMKIFFSMRHPQSCFVRA